MRIRGKYGITREADGTLANFLYWPWYWRDPLAVLGAFAGIWLFVWASRAAHPLLLGQIGGGIALLAFALIGYEVTVIGVGIVVLRSLGQHDAWHDPTWFSIAIGAMVGLCWHFYAEIRELKKQSIQSTETSCALSEKVDRLERQISAIYREILMKNET